MPAPFEMTPALEEALVWLEDPETHCFLTGRAGTGKSTLLRHFMAQTAKRVAILAPTGIAAINVGGQTIHSFFGFKPNMTPYDAEQAAQKKLKWEGGSIYKQVQCLVIDEVSMMRADLADCMDVFLRTVRSQKDIPFGGVKMIFVGDLFQLPPVVGKTERDAFSRLYPSPFFFDSKVLRTLDLKRIELEKIYRQTDLTFIDILNRIRSNTLTDEDLLTLNARVDESPFDASEPLSVILTPTNDKAAQINKVCLDRVLEKSRTFAAGIEGSFSEGVYPTDQQLELKKGGQVMLLNNDPLGRWVNGTMAMVTGFGEEEIEVKLEDGSKEEVARHTWEIFRYAYDVKKKRLAAETLGKFTQFPLKLGWALTIHKAQGKTFDRLVVDLDRGTFAPGQLYVALSRCRSLKGLRLTTPLKKSHAMVDQNVVRFMTLPD